MNKFQVEVKAVLEILKDPLLEPKFTSKKHKVEMYRDLKVKLKIDPILKILNDTLLESHYDNKLKRQKFMDGTNR